MNAALTALENLTMTGLIRHMTLGLAGSLMVTSAFAQNTTQPKLERRPAVTAAAVASPAPAPMLDRATGVGLVPLKGKIGEWGRFEAKYGYAYARGTGSSRRVYLLLTAEPAADVVWRSNNLEALGKWAEAKQTPFVIVVFDDQGLPDMMVETSGDGEYRSQARSVINGLPSLEVSFDINDGKRLSGRLTGGDGNCDGRYCDQRQNFSFDVTVVQ
jgi:hypothetical protein